MESEMVIPSSSDQCDHELNSFDRGFDIGFVTSTANFRRPVQLLISSEEYVYEHIRYILYPKQIDILNVMTGTMFLFLCLFLFFIYFYNVYIFSKLEAKWGQKT